MPDFKIDDFNNLIEQVQGIRNELAGNKDKKEEKEKRDNEKENRDKIIQLVTASIAIISLGLTIYTITVTDPRNYEFQRETDEKNYKFQRETQAYNFWLNYLKLASENPQLANGLDSIDHHPVDSIACRKNYHNVHYSKKTEKQFVRYAWFVANALGAAEYVSSTKDSSWNPVIDSIINAHIVYISSFCFDKKQYDTIMQRRFDTLIVRYTKNKK